MSKEQIYDEKIHPLIAEIIKICKEYGIAMIANFAIPNEDDPNLESLTNLPDETGSVPERHAAAVRAIRPRRPAPMMITTEHGDGSVTMTAIV